VQIGNQERITAADAQRVAYAAKTVAWNKPQDHHENGIHPVVTPFLAARRRAKDRAFERLYRDHVHAVYRYALAVLHNEADAEDVTQTTFLNAYRAYERGERPHTPHNWLIKIAHNVCRQRFRDSSRRPREVELDDSLTPAAADDSDVPTANEIRRALGFLAFNQRAALVMRELEGRSYAEIAQVLDISVSAVETLMFRARRALREQLESGLTCREAEQTLTRLQRRDLSSADRGALRAHLRECKDCATLERRQRAYRGTLEHLGVIPLPASLATFIGGGASGGAAAGGIGLGVKIATVLAAGLVVTGVGREPLNAGATDKAVPAKRPAMRTESAAVRATESNGTQPGTKKRSSYDQRARSKRSRSSAPNGGSAGGAQQPAPTQPAAAPGGPSGGADQQPSGGPPPPALHLRVPLHQPPPIQLPEIRVQLPELPPPLQLPPPPPIDLPPIQVPPILPPPPPGP
jgi:RNA polymerase sigma factor (sigma-70 family)